MGAVVERDAFAFHLRDAQVDGLLLHLEIGNAVAQQPAGLGEFFVDVHVVAGPPELLRASHAGGTGTDDRDALAGLHRRRLGLEPLGDGVVGDGAFDGLDGDRIVVEVERARRLARRRADPAGDLGEIVGRVQVARRFVPAVAIDEVVPVRNLVVHRAAIGHAGDRIGAMAIRHAAIHAARGLRAQFILGQRQHELAPMPDAFRDRLVVAILTFVIEEAGNLAHALFGGLHRGGLFLGHLGERAAIFERHHLAEHRTITLPVGENFGRALRAGVARMIADQPLQAIGVA